MNEQPLLRFSPERPLIIMYQSPPAPSILDITVVKARINPEISNPQKSAWFIFSVDGAREPVATPARPLSNPMMFGTPARFTFVPNENPYLYVTLCVYNDAGQMAPLARSRSRLSSMPFGSQFTLSLMSTIDKGKEIGQVYISGTLVQSNAQPAAPAAPMYSEDPYAQYSSTGYAPGSANPCAGAPNPYATAPPPDPYSAPSLNPYATVGNASPPNPYAAAGAPELENPYQNAGMQGTDGTKYFF